MKRDNGFDFINIKNAKEAEQFWLYLSREDERMAVAYYNTFVTSLDKAGNPMIVLTDMDHHGDQKKIAIVIVTVEELVMPIVEKIDEFCGED